MAIKDVIKEIRITHNYKITSDYWGRIGSMIKRYGEETVIDAIKNSKPKEIPLTGMLNIIERKCQFIISNGKGSIDELVNDILNSEE